jgi:hemoglobin
MSDTAPKADLDSPQRIADFVEAFYARLLKDPQLAPIFLDVAKIDIREHFPRIRAYWEKLLLGDDSYKRHTMNIHRELHSKRALKAGDFDLWLNYFVDTVDEHFTGPKAERAKRVATAIAGNMQVSLHVAADNDH